jgi:hypothetical protein
MKKPLAKSYDDNMLHRLPLFLQWADRKKVEYFNKHQEDFRKDPFSAPRKGIPPGQAYPFSFAKYEAAVHSVLYGTQFKGCKLTDVLAHMDHSPTLGLFKVWRTEERFKSVIEGLKEAFSTYIAGNILYEEFPPPLPDYYEAAKRRGLQRKICFIREAFAYGPDLLIRISRTINQELTCNPALTVPSESEIHGRPRQITDYLGFYIWTITLLYSIESLGKKKKNPRLPIWIQICKEAIGYHWEDPFITNYLKGNVPQTKWFFEVHAENFEEQLDRGLYLLAQKSLFEELAAIIKVEKSKLKTGENDVSEEDLDGIIDFLWDKYEFVRYGGF